MALSSLEISVLETAFQQFGDIQGIERACREYRKELNAFHPDLWKLNLASLERINGQAFAKVLQTIPPQRRGELASFIQKNKGKPLPNLPRYETLSAAKSANP